MPVQILSQSASIALLNASFGAGCKLNSLTSNDMPRADERRFPWPANRPPLVALILIIIIILFMGMSCEVERRKSDRELGLNPQQAAGRHLYDQYCDRCHAPYSSRKRQGPSLKGLFKHPYMHSSGLPASDERVQEIVRYGRGKMPGNEQVLSPADIDALVAYLHTL